MTLITTPSLKNSFQSGSVLQISCLTSPLVMVSSPFYITLGPHNCPGQKMAMIELKMMLIHLVRKYKLSFPDQEVKWQYAITYGTRGLKIDFEKR